MLHHMQDIEDASIEALSEMSVQELLELQARIHTAVRAAIREKNERRLMPATTSAAATAAPAKSAINLERERDAWLASRRKGG